MKIGDRTYRILHPEAAEALIDEQDFDRDERLPYWADLWPSAVALARYVSGLELVGRRAIELGCGVGLPSIVALERGAKALATDHYEAALDFTAFNARANLGREPEVRLLDWHAPEAESLDLFDLILAADVLYERRNVAALAALIPSLLAPGGEVLLADPRRKNTPWFLGLIEKQGFANTTESMAVEQGERRVEVMIHKLRRQR